MDKLKKIKHLFALAMKPSSGHAIFERYGEALSPNVRALRLAVTIADILTSLGISVSDVTSMALDITDRYCKRKVQFDISYTIIMASQDRGDDREPLTMIRHAQSRSPNNRLVQDLQELARDISKRGTSLDDAEQRLEDILKARKTQPYWINALAGAFISGGVGLMFGASYIILAIMFVFGFIVSYILRVFTHQRVPAFFSQVAAAAIMTLIAASVYWAGTDGDIALFRGLNSTLIVIGGIIMLVAGLSIVGAIQDAIDEYYITANARLAKAIMMTSGIVAGVLIGLYIANKFGVHITVESEAQKLGRDDWQYYGAILIAAGYAVSVNSKYATVIVSGLMGLLSWFIYLTASQHLGLSAIVSSGVAAFVSGGVGTLIARIWRTPSIGLITAGVIPLVPGLTLFNGLLAIVEGASQGNTDAGVLTIMTAVGIALAIGSGVSFGVFVTRPLRRTLVQARNRLPTRYKKITS